MRLNLLTQSAESRAVSPVQFLCSTSEFCELGSSDLRRYSDPFAGVLRASTDSHWDRCCYKRVTLDISAPSTWQFLGILVSLKYKY